MSRRHELPVVDSDNVRNVTDKAAAALQGAAASANAALKGAADSTNAAIKGAADTANAAFKGAADGAKAGLKGAGKVGWSAVQAFKEFLFKNNLQSMLTAFVVGAAFTEMVKALVSDLITPFIAAIFQGTNFDDLTFTINKSVFRYGHAINMIITFLVVTLIMFFCFVLPLQKASAIFEGKKPDDTKKCVDCCEKINIKASRCKYCCAAQPKAVDV